MKSKDVIFKHLKEVGYNGEARIKICGYLTGIGIKENEEMVEIKIGENTFADFLEWEKKEYDKESKIIWFIDEVSEIDWCSPMFRYNPSSSHWTYKSFLKLKPKFKVGDWVRATDCGCTYCTHQKAFIAMGFLNTSQNEAVKNGCVGKVFNMYYCDFNERWLFGIQFGNKQCVMNDRGIEVYYPKEGEFFYVKTKNPCFEYIGTRDDVVDVDEFTLHCTMEYSISTNILYKFRTYTCLKESISELRPATESEIQLLKDKVKEKYNLEWNGKELVDIKKSDKELFEEWKKDVKIGISRAKFDVMSAKVNAYKELYFFSQWVNQFYDKECAYCYFNSVDNMVYIDNISTCIYDGSIYFNSKQAAQRAIDCLGEDLIKTALK
jgi:hypothetical protein